MNSLGTATTQDLIGTAKSQASIQAIAQSANKFRTDRTAAAAKEFESVFISEMLKPMFETIDVDETFGGGKGEEVFRGLLVQEYGKILSNQGGVGIADSIQAELIKTQEQGQQTTGGKA